MEFTENLRKGSASKLLAFRSPSPVFRAAGGPLHVGREQTPHEVSMLRRPSTVEAVAGSRMHEHESMVQDAHNLLVALDLFSGRLAGSGVLSDAYKHFSDELKALTGPISTLIARLATASQPQASFDPGTREGVLAGESAAALSGTRAYVHPSTGHGRKGEPIFMREPLRPELHSHGSTHRAAHPDGPLNSQGEPARDVGVMVKSCERLLGAMAGPGIALHISYERGVGELIMSGECLIRVLVNLVKNAGEAMPGGGRIAIQVRKGPGPSPSALLTVEDHGTGIPAHAMGQLFQPGFSSKKPRHAWPASAHQGLGLTIVRDLVEDAGGCVRVTSTLRKGSTFEIKLPCRRW